MRTLFFVVIVFILLAFVFIASPFVWFDFKIHRWEHQIRRDQNPEELRTWTADLIATYSTSNQVGRIPGTVTNRPPPGIPASGRFPRVLVQHDRYSENGHELYHVLLIWDNGSFMPMWGMDIGDTNFVCTHKNPKLWVPGVYFFLEP